jgi:hypothetical protein
MNTAIVYVLASVGEIAECFRSGPGFVWGSRPCGFCLEWRRWRCFAYLLTKIDTPRLGEHTPRTAAYISCCPFVDSGTPRARDPTDGTLSARALRWSERASSSLVNAVRGSLTLERFQAVRYK